MFTMLHPMHLQVFNPHYLIFGRETFLPIDFLLECNVDNNGCAVDDDYLMVILRVSM